MDIVENKNGYLFFSDYMFSKQGEYVNTVQQKEIVFFFFISGIYDVDYYSLG